MDLVIMAAGMGSRFGGLKQIEPIDEYGNFIIDYSIYDAIRAGFDRVVFIIKKENFEIFKSTIGKRIEDKIEVVYVFQELEDVLEDFEIPEGRVKPWGTAHAIYACRNVVKGNFAIINADDFYGFDAYRVVAEFLKENNEETQFAMAGYLVKNTMTEFGAVKRGVVEVENKLLTNIIESSIEKVDGKIIASPLDGRNSFEVEEDDMVSMNMFAFSPLMMDALISEFPLFLETVKNNPLKSEFLIPDVVADLIHQGKAKVNVLKTSAVWHGVTYKEDKPKVVKAIKSLVDAGEYPVGVWKN